MSKILTILIYLNITLFAWQTILRLHLSIQGDRLNFISQEINASRAQIDALSIKLSQNNSLSLIADKATKLGFRSTTFIRLIDDKLAIRFP